MLSLKELQDQMAHVILTRAPEVEASPQLLGAIVSDGLSAGQRLQIHQNNFRETVSDVVVSQFPIVEAFVGQQFLKACAIRFVHAHPPVGSDLESYGAEFADFLRGFPQAAGVPYVADIAALEWHIHTVQERAAEAVLSERSAKLALNAASARLARHVSYLESAYPIMRLWMASQGYLAPEQVNMASGGEAVLVAQINGGVTLLPLTKPMRKIIKLLVKDSEAEAGVAPSAKSAILALEMSAALAELGSEMDQLAQWPVWARR